MAEKFTFIYEQETKWISKCKLDLFLLFVARNFGQKQTSVIIYLTYSPRWTSIYIFTIKILY